MYQVNLTCHDKPSNTNTFESLGDAVKFAHTLSAMNGDKYVEVTEPRDGSGNDSVRCFYACGA